MPAMDPPPTMSNHGLYYYDQFPQAGLGRHTGLLHHHHQSSTSPPFEPRTEAIVPYYTQHQYPSTPHTQKLPVTPSWVEPHPSIHRTVSGPERSKVSWPIERTADRATLSSSLSSRALPFDEHDYAECSAWVSSPTAQHLGVSPDSGWQVDPSLSLPHLLIHDNDGSFGSLSLSPLSDIDATPDLLPGDLCDDSEDDSPFLQSPLSARSQACELPSLDVVEVDDDWITQSPSLSRRSDSPLPINDSDDSLDFKDSSSSLFASEILHHSSGHSLLLFDDFDPPCPRSQSPSSYDDELPYDFPSPPSFVPENAESEVLQRFLDLRKRSQTAERIARTSEQQLLQEGLVEGREEARHRRKREKERCKEISALLRLKLDKAPPSPSASSIGSASPESLALGSGSSLSAEEAVAITASSNAATTLAVPSCSPRLKNKDHKTVISSMDQLVARMVFRRREAAAPRQSRLYRHSAASPLGLSRHNQLPSPKSPELVESMEELELGVPEDDDDDDDLPQLRGFGFQ